MSCIKFQEWVTFNTFRFKKVYGEEFDCFEAIMFLREMGKGGQLNRGRR